MPVSCTCIKCGAAFKLPPSAAKTAKYCSRACWSVRGQRKPCERCNKIFLVEIGTRERFCSRKCSSAFMRGKHHGGWKGGASLKSERKRMGTPLREWRLKVFRRDGFRCQWCGTNRDLNAHHIKGFAAHPRLRLTVSNGLTVCIDCHGIIHGKDFRKRFGKVKVCRSCGKPCSGRSPQGLCRSCGTRRWNALGRQRRAHKSDPSHPAQLSFL